MPPPSEEILSAVVVVPPEVPEGAPGVEEGEVGYGAKSPPPPLVPVPWGRGRAGCPLESGEVEASPE